MGFASPLHLPGGPFQVVATDGSPLHAAARLAKDTITVAPGERYDAVWTARAKGNWLPHCHILPDTTNDDREVQGAAA